MSPSLSTPNNPVVSIMKAQLVQKDKSFSTEVLSGKSANLSLDDFPKSFAKEEKNPRKRMCGLV